MSITTQQAKKISIVQYLLQRGHKHHLTRRGEYWYLSPLRKEKEPSFAVKEGAGSHGEDLWDDFGFGGGGSIIDLAMAMEKLTSVPQALSHLSRYYSGSNITTQTPKPQQNTSLFRGSKESSIKNIVVRPLNHYVLLKYLKSRGIGQKNAQKYLRLVWYENSGRKNLFSFGWQNMSGAWELRSNDVNGRSFKAVTGKKDMTMIPQQPGTVETGNVYVFEGMLDYLSALELKGTDLLNGDTFVLNSTTLVSRFIAMLDKKQYKTIYTFFDNDDAGQKALNKLQTTQHPDIRQQVFYEGFKDVNDYLVSKQESI